MSMVDIKPKAVFEPLKTKIGSGWNVLVTLPNGDQTQISGFDTKANAREWIANKSASWLQGYRGGRYW